MFYTDIQEVRLMPETSHNLSITFAEIRCPKAKIQVTSLLSILFIYYIPSHSAFGTSRGAC